MEVGHLIHFSSQKYPFVVETEPCLDLDCCCSVMGLTLREVDLSSPPRDRLKFTLRVCLKTWTEDSPPPPRSLEVETLAREFMVRFPVERRQELGEAFQRRRAQERRLQSVVLTGSRDELVTYSQVVQEEELRQGIDRHALFFVFEGREFFVEDQYCANPECDCQQVHLEFWERVHEFIPQHRITLKQCLLAAVSLQGELKELRFSEESASTTKYLLAAWRRRGSDQLAAYRRRYQQNKTIGARSFPAGEKSSPQSKLRTDRAQPSPSQSRKTESLPVPVTAPRDRPRIGRNDPCPCGSGLKFKRCCARRPSATK
jgi:hypothetical protein